MDFKTPLLVVKDIDESVRFYHEVLGLKVVADFGANKALTGDVALQTLGTWKEFIDGGRVSFGGNDVELSFEEEDFDSFIAKLKKMPIRYVHEVKEHAWGQRVVRFLDPDDHIIEVGEKLAAVAKRFYLSGMSIEGVAKRMGIQLFIAKNLLK